MKNTIQILVTFIASVIILTGCSTMSVNNEVTESVDTPETLYVYDDGRMRLDSRYVDSKDVVIYDDGRGGEKAAVKVRFPLHSDFYRDSILVVRVVNKLEESVAENNSAIVENVN